MAEAIRIELRLSRNLAGVKRGTSVKTGHKPMTIALLSTEKINVEQIFKLLSPSTEIRSL